MKIAIIGAGVSGLTAAHLLHRRHRVTLFEAADKPGGHTNTIRVDTAYETHHLDTGFIVFNDRNYPNFERLLLALGVRWQESEMSFSVSDQRGAFEYSSHSLNALFANRGHIVSSAFFRMLADIPRFQRAARELLQHGEKSLSLRDWLAERQFSREFVERLIVPQVSAVWSADPQSMWSFPALFLAQFFDNHGMLGLRSRPQWRTISGGSATYVDALTSDFDGRIRLGSPVEAVRRSNSGVEVNVRGQGAERFDRVVFATHADQALALLHDATTRERELLGAIRCQPNEAVLHTDTRLLPKRRRAWASWNYHLLDQPSERTTVTYHLNRLQRLQTDHQFCVTLNRTDQIDPTKVLRRIDYAHPVYTPASVTAQGRIAEISGVDRTHFCGAYWGWGFHEDGVNSALRIAAELGVQA